MYNSNLTPNLLLGVPVGEGTGATPRTPEIVNSLMAMTDPFKLIRAGAGAGGGVRLANSPPSSNSNSIVAASSSPPSLQHTRTQLIKEGLKLTIQSKRKSSLSVSEEHQPAPAPLAQAVMPDRPSRNRTMSEDVSQDSQDYSSGGLTPQDEERRRMRRERNKIAATKCRQKKRLRGENLIHESEVLESQNSELKMQIHALETEKRGLVSFLNDHRPCVKMTMESRESPSPSYHQQVEAFSRLSSSEPTHSRLSSVDAPFSRLSSAESSITRLSSAESSHSRLSSTNDSFPRLTSAEPLQSRLRSADPSFASLSSAGPSHSPCSFSGYATPPLANPSTTTVVALPYSNKFVASYKSSTYHQTLSSSVETVYHHRQQDDRYCRTGEASTSVSSYMCEDLVGSVSPMLPTSGSYYTKIEPSDYMRPSDHPFTNVRCDSPQSTGYTRPSSISLTTSSSDYESNTELLDSPSVPLAPNYHHHFDKEPSSVGMYPGGFTASSCIT
ncbi:bZIP transcription factor [Nesidiocoris tenuis]|uniref:BZIP transcription factor n=1 Tax=Nesidiocoris tenuis TaxID=355587 RepID=A0ABN7B9G4_9HEMI|nr:bZIP transcription factor [Nesidiocoris tenuis]